MLRIGCRFVQDFSYRPSWGNQNPKTLLLWIWYVNNPEATTDLKHIEFSFITGTKYPQQQICNKSIWCYIPSWIYFCVTTPYRKIPIFGYLLSVWKKTKKNCVFSEKTSLKKESICWILSKLLFMWYVLGQWGYLKISF